ncbi:MAG: hypothetical protein LC108_01680 [Anaerolineales bacterium]|nr:hypothetical protein [Anaerolineales bacterium]
MTNHNRPTSPDEKLSAFTDQALKGEIQQPASASTDELHSLEETVLRLHKSMPNSALEESTKKEMLARLNARIRKEQHQPQKKTFWARLFSLEWIQSQYRPQLILAAGVLTALIIALAFFPASVSDSSTTVGTALKPGNHTFIILGLIILFCALAWFTRKK